MSRKTLRARFESLLTERRLRLYPRAVLLALSAGFLLAVGGGSGTRALFGRLGGDFPAFYAAAQIAARGELARLYDFELQAETQRALFPVGDGPQWLPFAYPPYVALWLRPLAALPYRAAYLLHTLAMAAALALCSRGLCSLVPALARYGLETYAAAISFVPMLVALLGGQPAPLLVAALVMAFEARAREKHWLAGAWLSVLWWKPQYALAYVALFALGADFRIVLVAVGAGIACGFSAWLASGPAWLPDYLGALARFHQADQGHNAAHSIGWLGVAEAVLGTGNPVAYALAALLALGCLCLLARVWRDRSATALVRLGCSAPLVLLLQPHAMQYDAALLVPSFALVAAKRGRAALVPLGALYVLALAMPLSDRLGVSPAFAIVLATAWLAFAASATSSPPSAR